MNSGRRSRSRGVRPVRDGEPVPALSASQFRVLLLTLLLGVLLAALDGTIVAVALPTIVGDLGDAGQTSWVITAYLMTATASIPLYGRVSDSHGRKATFLAAVTIFLAGSALCALAQGIGQLTAARAVQGLGGGGLLTLALAVVADLTPPRARARYQAVFGAVYGVASMIGPPVGGLIVDHASWRWIFVVNLPLGAVVLAVLGRRLQLPARRREHCLDVLGAVLLVGGVGSALSALAQAQVAGFASARSWAPAVVAVAALTAFAVNERRTAEPMVPARLFAAPALALSSAIAFLVGAAMFAAIVFVPLSLQLIQHRSAASSGLMLVALTTGLVLTTAGAGRSIARTGRYKALPVLGTALVTAAMLGLTRLDRGTSTAVTLGTLAVLGLGLGLVSQVLVVIAQSTAGADQVGSATASISFFRSLGGTVGTAVGAAVLASVLSDRLGPGAAAIADPDHIPVLPETVAALPDADRAAYVAAFTDAAQAVFWIGAALAALAFVLALAVPAVQLAPDGPAGATEPSPAPVPQS